MLKTTKTKRIVTKIGDIFCVELDNNAKGFFQFIAIDSTCMNSSVVRVFMKHYPIDKEVSIEDVVSDKVDFYTHTILRAGIDNNIWYKVGKSQDVGENDMHKVYFGLAHEFKHENFKLIPVDPMNNWNIWQINACHIFVGSLPERLYGHVEDGSVMPFHLIKARMISGYYPVSLKIYSVSKRTPRPEYKSYIKDTSDGKDIYICFQGDYFEKAVFPIEGKLTKISRDEAVSNNMEIISKKFSDTNWKTQNFITEDEFNKAWDSTE